MFIEVDRLVLLNDEVRDVDIKLDFALFNHVDFISVIFLLVKDITSEKSQRFQLRHNCEQEFVLLVFEEIDSLNDFSMGALDDLVSELLRQVVEKLILLCKTVGRRLIVLKMSLDLRKHGEWHLVALFEFLEDG